jgi:hypothetical protein
MEDHSSSAEIFDNSIYPEQPFLLSKIFITGPLIPTMPYIVLRELALECGVIVSLERMKNDPLYYAKVYAKIAKFKPPLLTDIGIQKDICVHFVNPMVEWDEISLKKATNFLHGFYHLYQLDNQKDLKYMLYSTITLATPDYVYQLNSCILYAFCRFHKIQIPLESSYDEIQSKVWTHYYPTNPHTFSINLSMDEHIKNNYEKEFKFQDENEEFKIKVRVRYPNEEEKQKEQVKVYVEDSEQEKKEERENVENQVYSENWFQQKLIELEEVKEDQSEKGEKGEKGEGEGEGEFDGNRDSDGDRDGEGDGDREGDGEAEDDVFDFYEKFEEIKVIGNLFQDIGYLQNNFYPTTDTQAVVAGAIVYLTDLSFFSNPLVEFKQIRKGKNFKNKVWKEYQTINPNLLDLNLYFNPYLPEYFYIEQTLEHHLNLFSFPVYDFVAMDSYEILQELYLKETFHLGWHPNIVSKETPIFLETVNELEMEEILVFGSLYEKNLSFTTWRELTEIFSKTNTFTNPFELNSVLDIHKIHRLVKLGNFILSPPFDYQYLFKNYHLVIQEQIKKCLEKIDEILFQQRIESEGFSEYKIIYHQSPEELKIIFQNTLDQLFSVCMYMRGWKGKKDPYPIQVVPYADNDETEKNTIESLFVLDEWNEKTSGVFYEFPLILWKNEFVKSALDEQGLTIGQRIKMVKNGENSTISSCIRMSSNVLGSTYCFYCKLFDIQPKFKIENLRNIQ